MTNFKNLEQKIIKWADEKGILDKATPESQFEKTQEEVDELRLAIKNNDIAEVIDGIGDVTVTLIILCQMYKIDFEACLQIVYDVISKRTGKMVNGKFVKDK